MATSINTRISDDLEEGMKKLQEKMSKTLPKGAEVTMSSLVRGGIEKLIEEYNEEAERVAVIKFPLGSMSFDEVSKLDEMVSNILSNEDIFPSGRWRDAPETKAINTLENELVKLKNCCELERLKKEILEKRY